MGMYTGLRFKVTVKPKYREMLDEIINSDTFLEWGSFEGTPFTKEWEEYNRSSFIPWGCVCYMPDSWGDNVNKYNNDTGTWEVVCSLKNYCDTIEYFLEKVLSPIIESYEYIEHLYEENDEPTKYIPKLALDK